MKEKPITLGPGFVWQIPINKNWRRSKMTTRRVYGIIRRNKAISYKKILAKLHSNDIDSLREILGVLLAAGKIDKIVAYDNYGPYCGIKYRNRRTS